MKRKQLFIDHCFIRILQHSRSCHSFQVEPIVSCGVKSQFPERNNLIYREVSHGTKEGLWLSVIQSRDHPDCIKTREMVNYFSVNKKEGAIDKRLSIAISRRNRY